MRRINIVKDNQINTVTFRNQKDLFDYIFYNIQVKYDTGLTNADKSKEVSKLVWNLNIAQELISEWGYKFSINSKKELA